MFELYNSHVLMKKNISGDGLQTIAHAYPIRSSDVTTSYFHLYLNEPRHR